MSTAVVTKPVVLPQSASLRLRERSFPFALVTALTILALAIHGYHPYSEDGGIYVSGIKYLLNPALYSHSLPFVEAHLRFSLFAPAVADIVRLTHLSLDVVLLGIYLAGIWATLFAVWLLAERCYSSRLAHAGATTLAAVWLTLPVAGTSLILNDPYVTARSISFPCTLLALVAVLDYHRATTSSRKLRSLIIATSLLLLAVAVHPLMGAYGLGDVLLLLTILSRKPAIRRWGTASLCLSAFALAAILEATAARDSPAYVQVTFTRYYWFLSQWQWYEVVGILAPLLILALVAFIRRRSSTTSSRSALAAMAVSVGITAILVSLAFAHQSSASHIVARLQPLRAFQVIYMLMILVLGAALGEHVLRRHRWRWIVLFSLFGSILFFVQRSTYPSSAHIEWPRAASSNQWKQAFLWISRNIPRDAYFALDANYITLPGEDAQNFRAFAERSALPDYSKDGGEASITPSLTSLWDQGQRAQTHLSLQSDAERLTNLRPLAVDWIVLQQQARTNFDCPYRNSLVKVCRLP